MTQSPSKKLKKLKNLKKTNKTKKGGEVIAAGSYGCTFKPALKCENSNTRYNGISKLLDNSEAENEWAQITQIKNIIKNIPNNNKYFLVNN